MTVGQPSGDDVTTDFPITAHLDGIAEAFRRASAVIIKAEPGAGKTTGVPPRLMSECERLILVIEPRRLAAKLSAERIAETLGETSGQRIGYQIRFEGRSSQETRVKFITEGLFVRMLLEDPALRRVDAVVIDEFHERHLNTDLALALVRALQQSTRPDLKLVVMSATLDVAAMKTYLPDAEAFDVPGKVFPVAITYLDDPSERLIEQKVARAVARMLQDGACPGDILVFLPGMAAIQRSADLLRGASLGEPLTVLPLSADLPAREQKRVFEPSPARKVILATNVAETSLTLPGVTGVIDSGLARIADHATWSGLTTLDVKKISQASCIQRTGRAGRVRPGVCYRLFSENDYLSRAPYLAPEIERLDLSQTVLDVLAITPRGGSANELAERLPWFSPPRAEKLASAVALLQSIGALDEGGGLTPRGQALARWPLHPRLAAIALKGEETDYAGPAMLAVCLISEGMLIADPHAVGELRESDLIVQMEIFAALHHRRPLAYQAWERQVDRPRYERVRQLYRQLASSPQAKNWAFRAEDLDLRRLNRCLLAGYPDRVAKLRPAADPRERGARLFNLCLGRGGQLARTSVAQEETLILAIDASESHARGDAALSALIHVASGLDKEALFDDETGLLSERREVIWDEPRERARMAERIYYGGLVIDERFVDEPSAMAEEVLARALTSSWPKPFEGDSDLVSYHGRLHALAMVESVDEFPVFEGEMLALLIAAIAEGKTRFAEIRERRLGDYIRDQLTYEQAARLDREVPLDYRLPSGRRLEIHYDRERPPWVESRLQDFFGMAETPTIASGRIPLVLHLLAPNFRAVQVTNNLMSFWQNAYPEIMNQLKRRYPRHSWPDDPVRASPPEPRRR